MRALARKSALNARAREEALLVIESLAFDGPSTKAMLALLGKLGVAGRKVLILTDGQKDAAHLSARNLPTVHVMPYTDASTYHILCSEVVLVVSGALQSDANADAAAPDADASAQEG